MSGKTISELPFLETPNSNGMLPLEYSGTTYHIMFSSITSNNSNNISYIGKDYDCLKIKNNTSLTTVIESIGDVLCNPQPYVNPCLSLLLEDEFSGLCKSPMKYVFDLTTLSWCNENQPYVCDGINPINYLINTAYQIFENENQPYVCDGVNPFVYLIELTNEAWENENQPYVCDGIDAIDYLFQTVNEAWENENQPYVCDGINPINYLINTGYEIFENDNQPYVCDGENSLKYFIDLVKNSWSNIQ
jgi:hypothetical protein